MWRFLSFWRRRRRRRNPYRPLGSTPDRLFGPGYFTRHYLRSPSDQARRRRLRRRRQIRFALLVIGLIALGWILRESLLGVRLF